MPLIVYCTAVLTSLSDSVSYITFLFLEWRILLRSEAPDMRRRMQERVSRELMSQNFSYQRDYEMRTKTR